MIVSTLTFNVIERQYAHDHIDDQITKLLTNAYAKIHHWHHLLAHHDVVRCERRKDYMRTDRRGSYRMGWLTTTIALTHRRHGFHMSMMIILQILDTNIWNCIWYDVQWCCSNGVYLSSNIMFQFEDDSATLIFVYQMASMCWR